MTRRLFGLILTVALAGTWNIATVKAADLVSGKKVYADKCARCHGDTGKGNGPRAEFLEKKPMDYTDKAKMAKISDSDLKDVVLEGKQPMPAFKGKIADRDLDDVIAYIRTLAGR